MPIVMNKRIGETPLQCLDRLRIEKPELAEKVGGVLIPLTYAGRLDPIAEGVLVVLVGEECKDRHKHLSLPKKYEAEILWQFETDTYDVLGKIVKKSPIMIDTEKAHKVINNLKGVFNQKYPPFSSKPIGGKPLFLWAREGKLDSIKNWPSQDIQIEEAKVESTEEVVGVDLFEKIKSLIEPVKGDFRQAEILADWASVLESNIKPFFVTKVTIACSSGTYIRGLAHSLGGVMGCGAVVLTLKRVSVGDYTLI